jgi:hypothetical protein
MASSASQFVLNADEPIETAVRQFAEQSYGQQRIFDNVPMLAYHTQLSDFTKKLAKHYFSNLYSKSLAVDTEPRINNLCQAALLLSVIYRCGKTIDDVLLASSSDVAQLVAVCTPDARLYSPRRVSMLLGQLPKLSIDIKLLLLSDNCLTAELRSNSDKYASNDSYRILSALDEFNGFELLRLAKVTAIKKLRR